MSTQLPRNGRMANVVMIPENTVRNVESLIHGCEHCDEGAADYRFDWVLGRVMGVSNYILESPARCPDCRRSLKGTTLVSWH